MHNIDSKLKVLPYIQQYQYLQVIKEYLKVVHCTYKPYNIPEEIISNNVELRKTLLCLLIYSNICFQYVSKPLLTL